jgi:hypothetical protein
MASVRRRLGRVEVTLDGEERELLLEVVDDLAPELGIAARTSQKAYDDPDLDREYQHWTKPDIDMARDADVDALRGWLGGAEDRVRLDEDTALAWLRALNHLRLVAGARLGIEEDGWEESAPEQLLGTSNYTVLITLGWLQEGIVAALEG